MSMNETLVLLAVGYAVAVFAIVGVAILQYETSGVNLRRSSIANSAFSHSTSTEINLAKQEAMDTVEYGIFGDGAATDGNFHSLTHFAIKDAVETRKFVSTDALEFEVPWLPSVFHNGWFFLGLLILVSLIISALVLGPVQLRRKVKGWKSWLETSDNIRRGMLLPNFFIFIADGVFHVVGPLCAAKLRPQLPPDPSLKHDPFMAACAIRSFDAGNDVPARCRRRACAARVRHARSASKPWRLLHPAVGALRPATRVRPLP
jgi:hypothetical protein